MLATSCSGLNFVHLYATFPMASLLLSMNLASRFNMPGRASLMIEINTTKNERHSKRKIIDKFSAQIG